MRQSYAQSYEQLCFLMKRQDTKQEKRSKKEKSKKKEAKKKE